jgi:hypothetical protein
MVTDRDAAFVNYLESIMADPELSLAAKHAAIRRAVANRGGDTEPYQHYLRTLEDQMRVADADRAQGDATSSDT